MQFMLGKSAVEFDWRDSRRNDGRGQDERPAVLVTELLATNLRYLAANTGDCVLPTLSGAPNHRRRQEHFIWHRIVPPVLIYAPRINSQD